MYCKEMYCNVLLCYKDSLLRVGVWEGSLEAGRAGTDWRLGRLGFHAERGSYPLVLKEGWRRDRLRLGLRAAMPGHSQLLPCKLPPTPPPQR